jgi:hypothetical protein
VRGRPYWHAAIPVIRFAPVRKFIATRNRAARPRAAVVIKPITADSLRKARISAVKPQAFGDFYLRFGNSEPETKLKEREAGIFWSISHVCLP